MFTIYAPDASIYADTKRVLDPESGITLQLIALTGRYPGGAFILAQGDTKIPFHTAIEYGLIDPSSGENYKLTRIESFGGSIYVDNRMDVDDFVFSSVAEEVRWRRIAAEALLVFGEDYDGLDYDQSYERVELNGEVLTRKDFGYSS